jgi:aqualysin 1
MRIKLIGMTLCLLMASVFVSCDEPRVEQQQQREPQGIAKLASVDEQNPMIGSYIVVLKHNAKSPPGLEHAMGPYRAMKDMTITDSFEMIRGFAAKIPEARLRHLKEDPNVEFIEPVQIASICSTASYQTLDWGVSYVGGDSSSTKSNDHGGAVTTNGVEVYVVDTGIDPTHPDLNVGGGANFAMVNYVIDSTAWQDEHSHGTHVAGIIGAKDNYAWTVGMAPGVKLFSVRVFDATGSGSSTGILRGLSWVLSQKLARPTVPMVVNMSLICGPSLGLDRAVQTLIDSGVVVVVAAGNSAALASNYSPSRAPMAITVAATTPTGSLATFSNYGSSVDILAPGTSILSARKGGGTMFKSGTSMACPHVTGAAALFLSKVGNSQKRQAEVTTALLSYALPWGKSLPSGTPNKVLRVKAF